MRHDLDLHRMVVEYHDATKHHPGRFARGPGYLDWATQPDPFRRFAGAELVRLALPADDHTVSYDALYDPHRTSASGLTADAVSRFFYLSLALSAWKQYRDTCWALRCNPSSGNLHPTEGYALLPAIDSIGSQPALYHYAPREHGLERRRAISVEHWNALMTPFPGSAFLVGLSSIHWREAWKYGERAFRYCNHDVGHALAALRLAAAALGWCLHMLDELSDDEVAALLGLSRSEDFENAEAEVPDLLAVVHAGPVHRPLPRTLDSDAVGTITALPAMGRANTLSPDHVAWDIIDDVAEATRKPRAIAAAADRRPEVLSRPSSAESASAGWSAARVIRRRRSAVAFDGRSSISLESLNRMLMRVVPGDHAAPPWDAVAWPPRIHLLMFVHLVDGLAPGLYALLRDPHRRELLEAATRNAFEWSRPEPCPESLPLFLLEEGDCRRAAAQLSLGQAIAGTSAFSLAMVAEFERTLREEGPWAYRRLFWEAGMIGQVLYLEAESAGVRATGIGAYFDDAVHDLFGFTGHAFQSMYHFTVGAPLEDERLTTWPAYPPRS